MRVLSLFDGIACARVALDKAKIPVEKYYASEIDDDAIYIAQKNWKDITEVGSVVGLLESGWIEGRIDLLIGGSPCQDLSIAKKGREGLAGKRSGLFYEFVRIKNELNPKWFILENVASMPKDAREEISRLMGVEPIMINAALVSAQNRKRLFWTNIPNVTLPEDKGILLKDILEDGFSPIERKSKTIRTSGMGSGVDDKHNWQEIKSYAIPATYYKENVKSLTKRKKDGLVCLKAPNGKDMEVVAADEPYVFKEARTEKGKKYRSQFRTQTGLDRTLRGKEDKKYVPSFSGKANCITTGLGVEGIVVVPEATKKGYAVAVDGDAVDGDAVDISFLGSKTRRGRVGKKAKNIMTSANIGVVQGGIVRKLTPIECERLQGAPDNYTAGIADSARYKCLGNAFNADVIAHILSFIP